MTGQPQPPRQYSAPQTRILGAAIELFSEFGVAGTSLQMIADKIGVTKAAVYHQFPVKEEIVLAIGHLVFDQMAAMADLAEQLPTQEGRRHAFLNEIIQLAVENRKMAGFLHQDPVILRLFSEHEPFRNMFERMDRLLLGASGSARARVTVAALITAIGGSVRHPLVDELDDDTLREELRSLGETLIERVDHAS